MLKRFYQMYFIFLLCVIIEINDVFSQEREEREPASLLDVELGRKCEEEYCTCDEIPQWSGVHCYTDRFEGFPELYFNSSKYFPERMFLGLSIFRVVLSDPNVTVAENFLEGITRLVELKVHRSSIKVVPDFRFVKDSMTNLDISMSLLTSLEGTHLQNLTSVLFLTFSRNSIQYIHPDVFWGTENVRFLDLAHNKLTSIPPKLLDPMKRLYHFCASNNNLLHVDNLFSVTCPVEIDLRYNNITHFSLPQIFEKALFFLLLSGNFITETSLSHSICNRNQDINLRIYRLVLDGNKIRNLKDCLNCLECYQLEMTGNRIEFLTEGDFLSVHETRELLLHENEILWIDRDTFQPLKGSLRKLDLSSNKISSLNGSVQYSPDLMWLNLSHNSIQAFAEDEFTGLSSLTKLFLEHNQIQSFGTTLQKLGNLEVLNITHNNIELITTDQLPNSLKRIYLADNPLNCDCKNLPVFEMLDDAKQKRLCSTGTPAIRLRKHHNCPELCSCRCTEYGYGFSLLVDCSSRNLSHVPHFVENNLPQLEVEDKALRINLEDNRLNILDAEQLPSNLVQLYLANNKLRRFPQSVMDNQTNLKQVSLSGNPWKCDCDALKFKKWLTSNSHIIKDFGNVRCGLTDIKGENLDGSVIWQLKDHDLCPKTDFTLIFSMFSLSFIILCLFVRRIYRKYELTIKVSLYTKGFTFVKEAILDHDKAFDAFISFSHKDDEFVIKDIISEIERRDPNIRLCLHYRHFRPGEPIINNIAHAVQESRNTVLILSRNFLASEWCLLEFKGAILQTLRDKDHRVIAVMTGELPKKTDPTIHGYLDSTTYLTWGESHFWNKLLFILPSQRCSDRSPVLRFVGDHEAVC